MSAIGEISEWDAFQKAHPQIQSVDLMVTPISGVVRGKRLRAHEIAPIYRSGRFLPESLLVGEITGADCAETGLVWANGDADVIARPAAGKILPQPWRGPNAAQLILSMYQLDGTPHDLDPRHVLQHVLDRFAADGLTPVLACELEFYLLDPERDAQGAIRVPKLGTEAERPQFNHVYGLRELDDIGPFIEDLLANGDAQNLPIEGSISEYGPGQYEIGLTHRADALLACDEAAQFKYLVKALARKHGMAASFMAKPFTQAAGNGLHIHVSINDNAGRNIFASDDPYGTPALRHAIAGMRALLPESLAILAPNANSYRRFRANSYAPVFPHWGLNNRTVSFRIPIGGPNSRHVEHRICGADANPYLAVASVLAGVHHGMKNRLDPGAAVVGDGYNVTPERREGDPPPLIFQWGAALQSLQNASILPQYLGERFCRIYHTIKTVEMERFESVVPVQDWDWCLHNA